MISRPTTSTSRLLDSQATSSSPSTSRLLDRQTASSSRLLETHFDSAPTVSSEAYTRYTVVKITPNNKIIIYNNYLIIIFNNI